MRALVTGATGFVGRHLVRQLDRPIVLSRSAARARQVLGDVEAYDWDPAGGPAPREALAQVDVVFHLAGDPVAEGRWTAAKKARIRDSRVLGTQNLVDSLALADRPPRVLVSASAVGYYGSRGEEILDEAAGPGSDFLADVCRGWEQAALSAADLGVRVVLPRIGVVLGRGGGALAKMLTPFRLGLGGRLASGTQWMPWVHLDDLVGMLLCAEEVSSLKGPFNAVAPHPVTNAEFTAALGKVLRRPTIFPMPAFALKLLVGDFAEVLLASQRCVPKAIQKAGYTFRYSRVADALAQACG